MKSKNSVSLGNITPGVTIYSHGEELGNANTGKSFSHFLGSIAYSVVSAGLLLGAGYSHSEARHLESRIPGIVAKHHADMAREKAEYAVFGPHGVADIDKDGKVSLSERITVYKKLGVNTSNPILFPPELSASTKQLEALAKGGK